MTASALATSASPKSASDGESPASGPRGSSSRRTASAPPARVTRPRSAAAKRKERPSARSDMTQTARPASCRPKPSHNYPAQMGADGPEQYAGESPAERQQPAPRDSGRTG